MHKASKSVLRLFFLFLVLYVATCAEMAAYYTISKEVHIVYYYRWYWSLCIHDE